jgi:hypothetical protein
LGATGLGDGNILVVLDGVTWGGGRARMTDPAGLYQEYTLFGQVGRDWQKCPLVASHSAKQQEGPGSDKTRGRNLKFNGIQVPPIANVTQLSRPR